jgi:peptide/nickel transport system ATP-binding protein
MRGKVLTTIPGAPPSLSSVPTSCSFAPRCGMAEAACEAGVPAMVEAGGGRRGRCIKIAAG